jgi:hypothetical protein
VDLNLDTLKREILEYLEAGGFAVFHASSGSLDRLPTVFWDTDGHPDYQAFLEVGRKCGTGVVVFSTTEFEADDLDALVAQLDDCELTREQRRDYESPQLDDCELTREQRRDYESRLREMRIFAGVTCGLELAFDYNQRLYIYQVQPDWYEEFLTIEDEIVAMAADDDDIDESDALGGYFSKN